MGKGSRDHTPKRKRQPQRAAVERDQDEATKPVGSLAFSLFAKRMPADQERLRRFAERHGLAEAEESLRRFGEKSGLKQFAEAVERRNAKTSPPSPQEPTPPQRKARKPGGGRPPTFRPEQRDWLREKYSNDLKAHPLLKKHDAAVAHIQNLAKAEYGIDVGRKTLLEQIIRPVLRA